LPDAKIQGRSSLALAFIAINPASGKVVDDNPKNRLFFDTVLYTNTLIRPGYPKHWLIVQWVGEKAMPIFTSSIPLNGNLREILR